MNHFIIFYRMVRTKRIIDACILLLLILPQYPLNAQSGYSHGLVIGFREAVPGPYQGNAAMRFQKDTVLIDSVDYLLPTNGVGDALFLNGELVVGSSGGAIAMRDDITLGTILRRMPLTDTFGLYGALHGLFRPQCGYLLNPDSSVQYSFGNRSRIWLSQLTSYSLVHKFISKRITNASVTTLPDRVTSIDYLGGSAPLNSFTSRIALVKSGFSDNIHFAVYFDLEKRKFYVNKGQTFADGIWIYPVDSLSIGGSECYKEGASVFSPDGTRYAFWTDCAIHTFDFDRCLGKLTNYRPISISKPMLPGGGLAFSASGRYLYANEYSKLYRVDMMSNALQMDTIVDGLSQTAYYPAANGLSLSYMYTAPDSSIYIVPPHRAKYMHVIECPDAQNPAEICFRKEGLALPVYNNSTILSNYSPDLPLLLGISSSCDSVFSSAHEIQTQLADLQISPNPANEFAHIRIVGTAFDQILVFNAQGQQLETIRLGESVDHFRLAIGSLPTGQYHLFVLADGLPVAKGSLIKSGI